MWATHTGIYTTLCLTHRHRLSHLISPILYTKVAQDVLTAAPHQKPIAATMIAADYLYLLRFWLPCTIFSILSDIKETLISFDHLRIPLYPMLHQNIPAKFHNLSHNGRKAVRARFHQINQTHATPGKVTSTPAVESFEVATQLCASGSSTTMTVCVCVSFLLKIWQTVHEDMRRQKEKCPCARNQRLP